MELKWTVRRIVVRIRESDIIKTEKTPALQIEVPYHHQYKGISIMNV